MIRKTISLDEESFRKVRFLLEKHNGNFSAAIKELISFASSMSQKHGSLEKALKKENLIDDFKGNGCVVLVPISILRWLANNSKGLVPGGTEIEDVVDLLEIEGPESVKKIFSEMAWPLNVSVTYHKGDDEFTLDIYGPDHLLNEFSASLASFFLARKHYKAVNVKNMGRSIKTTYIKAGRAEDAYMSILTHFGSNQNLFRGISNRTGYWRDIVNIFELYGYNFVILTRECFEMLVKGEPLRGEGLEYLVTLKTGKMIRELSLPEFLTFFGRFCQLNGIVDRVEFNDHEVRVYHSYRDPTVVDWLERSFQNMLEKTGYSFMPHRVYRIIIFKLQGKA
jgi:hypothetical protein